MRRLALLVFTFLCAPAFLLAQGDATGDVIATVRSESGAPLAEAEVGIQSRRALTDTRGVARLSVPAGRHRLTAARIGFQPVMLEVQVLPQREVSVTVTLEPVPYQLDPVTVLSTRIGSRLEEDGSPLWAWHTRCISPGLKGDSIMDKRTRRKLEMGRRALEFSRAHPTTDPGYLALVARLEQLMARAAELERQEKINDGLGGPGDFSA